MVTMGGKNGSGSSSRFSTKFTNDDECEDTQMLILQQVKKANSSLCEFSFRLDAMENRLNSVEEHQLKQVSCTSSSVDSSAEKVKRTLHV